MKPKTFKNKSKSKSKTKTQKKKQNSQWQEGEISSFVLSKPRVKSILRELGRLNKFCIHEEVGVHLPASNQQKSGRCWLFSYMNILRLCAISHYNLPETFSFSSAYLMFWDKFEKAKYFLQQVSTYSSLPLDDVENFILFRSVLSDGGTWNMLRNLIEKYGVVAYEDMKESQHTINSDEMNKVLSLRLKTFASTLRKAPKNNHTAMIDREMKRIHHFLTRAIGVPPKKSCVHNFCCNPRTLFMEHLRTLPGQDLGSLVCLVHAPHLTMNQYYTIPDLNNMKNGHPVLYFNTTMKIMKNTVVNQLSKRQPVWFGSDYDKFNYRDESLLNNTVYNFKNFPYQKNELFLHKTNAISHYQTNVNHAMMLCGYYYKVNKKNKTNNSKSIKYFIVENSHDAKLKKVSFENNYGMVVLSNSWFEKYAVMCVVNRDHIADKTMLKKVKDTSHVFDLPKWCNLGELL